MVKFDDYLALPDQHREDMRDRAVSAVDTLQMRLADAYAAEAVHELRKAFPTATRATFDLDTDLLYDVVASINTVYDTDGTVLFSADTDDRDDLTTATDMLSAAAERGGRDYFVAQSHKLGDPARWLPGDGYHEMVVAEQAGHDIDLLPATAIGGREVDALVAADRCAFRELQSHIDAMAGDRLRDFIRALERAHDHAVRDLSARHGGQAYSGAGGLLVGEEDD